VGHLTARCSVRRESSQPGVSDRHSDSCGQSNLFGDKADATLLRAVTVESLGFVLDAVRRDLLPLPMVVAVPPSISPRAEPLGVSPIAVSRSAVS